MSKRVKQTTDRSVGRLVDRWLAGLEDFESTFVNLAESREADPQHFREWPGREGEEGSCFIWDHFLGKYPLVT